MIIGDANGSIPTTQPIISKPMYGSLPSSVGMHSCLFVSQISIDNGVMASYGLRKRIEPVKNCRNVSKKDMKLNGCMPSIQVDPETYQVLADGELCSCDPVSTLPLTQSVYLF